MTGPATDPSPEPNPSAVAFPAETASGDRAVLLVGLDTPVRRALAALVEALGAVVVRRSPDQLPAGDELGIVAVAVLGDDLSARLGPEQVVSVLRSLRRWPVLVIGGLGAGASLLDHLGEVTGVSLGVLPAAEVTEYAFAADEPLLWPFGGLRLEEERPRLVAPLGGDGRALEPLVSTSAGDVLVRLAAPGPAVYLSAVSAWVDGPPPILRRSFCAESFMDTLPVMAFARAALAGRGWTRPSMQASCIVDDPNLRRLRYGHLDYRAAVRLAEERPFHLCVGFVPLDYQSTAAPVARLFHEHPEALSLLIHGNDHLRLELARDIPEERARESACQALARMERHRMLTGLSCPAVVTPPHGVCSPRWVRALRAAGYAAAVATATHPHTDFPEREGAGELHELFCGELSLHGFPIIIRYPAIGHRNRWLFAAWLGKPLITYAHHGDFAGAADELLAGVDFINDHVGPRWASIADVVQANYLRRLRGSTLEVRVFSNDVLVDVPEQAREIVIVKEGCDIPWESEVVLVDERRVEPVERSSETIRIHLATEASSQLRVRFLPSRLCAAQGWDHVSPRSRARRVLTETRDRLTPLVGMARGRG